MAYGEHGGLFISHSPSCPLFLLLKCWGITLRGLQVIDMIPSHLELWVKTHGVGALELNVSMMDLFISPHDSGTQTMLSFLLFFASAFSDVILVRSRAGVMVGRC